MLVAAILAAAAAVSAPPAPGEVGSPAAGAITNPAAPAASREDPVVCKDMPVTGSRLPKRYCLHQSGWDQLTRDSKDIYDRTESHTQSFHPGN